MICVNHTAAVSFLSTSGVCVLHDVVQVLSGLLTYSFELKLGCSSLAFLTQLLERHAAGRSISARETHVRQPVRANLLLQAGDHDSDAAGAGCPGAPAQLWLPQKVREQSSWLYLPALC